LRPAAEFKHSSIMDIEEIYKFLIESQGVERKMLFPSADLCSDLGIDGDDFLELKEEFASKYGVDMSMYRWYFHHGKEPSLNIGAMFSRSQPLHLQVKHIPVTPQILLEAVNAGKWSIEYPSHIIKDGTLETAINRVVLVFFVVLLAVLVVMLIYKIA
jgi:hypothetical protein